MIDKTMEEMIKEIYSTERNFRISSFWDAGYQFCVGNPISHLGESYPIKKDFIDFHKGVEWLYNQIVAKEKKCQKLKNS